MKIGILSDIHESLDHLPWAIATLQEHGADRLVILGDIFEMGRRLEGTVELLAEAGAFGVWGNHDFGLCRDNARPEDLKHYSPRVLEFMGRLEPRVEVEGCLFAHVEPWLDPENIEDLWYFEGSPETPDQLARIFSAVPNRVMFAGHYHRWLLATPEAIQPWAGESPIVLEPGNRYFVVIDAVREGKCAMFDTVTNVLTPLDRGLV